MVERHRGRQSADLTGVDKLIVFRKKRHQVAVRGLQILAINAVRKNQKSRILAQRHEHGGVRMRDAVCEQHLPRGQWKNHPISMYDLSFVAMLRRDRA